MGEDKYLKHLRWYMIFILYLAIEVILIAIIFAIFGIKFNYENLKYFSQWLTSIGIALLSVELAIYSIILAYKSGKIAGKSKVIAQKSKKRMDTIGDGEIKQSLINIQEIRKEYLLGLDEYLNTPRRNRNEPDYGKLQRINIFSTWLQEENLRKMIIYKKYMTSEYISRLFTYHRTLLDIVLNNCQNHIVTNESVMQLLTGISILYENFEEPNNFHERFYNLLRQYVGERESGEEFLHYITRKKREIRQRGFYSLFEPFQ